ncbi:MAG: hypothetical protein Phyf2KO_15630 [Phycisphaerales bacterium]
MGKYDPVREHLFMSGQQMVSMSFGEIGVLVGGLPRSAYTYQAWWANETDPQTHVQKRAWMAAGYTVDYYDLKTQRVRFRKVFR